MRQKAVSGIISILLVVGLLTLVFHIQLVKATGTIYIKADGSVVGTDKIQRDGDVYTFTDDIYDDIVIERDNIVVNGASYTLQGTGSGIGINMTGRSIVTIKNTNIKNFAHGVVLHSSSNNAVSGNNITENGRGFYVAESSNNIIQRNNIKNNSQYGIGILGSLTGNIISENYITNNWQGIYFEVSSNNIFYHNDFINNTHQTSPFGGGYSQVWDDGYPSGGNYWDDYNGTDLFSGAYQNTTGSDGIGDTPYVVHKYSDDRDSYPLMNPWRDLEPPLADAGNDQTITAGRTVIFDGSESTDDLAIRRYVWTFSDVTPRTLNGVHPTYAFNNVGDFEVTLNVSDYAGRWDTDIMWVHVLDNIPPTITILSPENTTYASSSVALTFKISESTSWIGYSLNSQSNVTISGNTTIVGLSDGTHTITVYANDAAGNMGSSDTVYFTVDTTPPNIDILSPENKTYPTSSVTLSFTVDEATSWIGYSLNNQVNVTITGNTTLSGLSDGSHSLVVCAEDAAGNTGTSEIVHFTIETPQPQPSSESFPIGIVAGVVIIGVVGTAVYLFTIRKKS